jgi:hypothetical protein
MIGSAALTLSACGGSASRRIPGPNVVGLSLTRAEEVITQSQLGFTEHLESGQLSVASDGRTIRTGWIVCGESYVNPTNVELNTKRRAC